jgi:hypothetical protein
MKQRKTKPKAKPRKHKVHVARKPDEVVDFKKRFLVKLAEGHSPGAAARLIKLSRSAAFGWKKTDEVFAEAWTEAVEAGLDEVEEKVYKNALDGNSLDAHFILKHRRREIYGNQDIIPAPNFILNINLAEQAKKLETMGLPVPLIDTDYEDNVPE